MASPYFELINQKSKESHIRLVFRYHREHRFKYYTGLKVPPKYFSSKNLVSRTFGRSAQINQYLKHLRNLCEDIKLEMLKEGKLLSTSEFKTRLETKLGLINNSPLFHDYIDQDYNERLDRYGDPNRIKGNKSRYSVLKRIIPNLPLTKITNSVITRGENVLFDEDKSPNYIRKIFKDFYYLMEKAKKAKNPELEVCLDFETHERVKGTKTKDEIYCTLEELIKMYYFEYPNNYLRNAANIFLIGAFTSMRVSEYMLVASDPGKHIRVEKNKEGREVKLITLLSSKKTGKKISLPMHWIIEDMLNKYEVHSISPAKLNKYLKTIGELIGMDQEFRRVEHKGRNKEEVVYKRFQLLSSHTARRSFVTILYIMGVDLKVIKMFTTHSTEKQLLEYMKLNEEMNAIRMSDHEFFTKKSPLKKVN